jgi:hypothetical protein
MPQIEQEKGESREETENPFDSTLSPFACGLRSTFHACTPAFRTAHRLSKCPRVRLPFRGVCGGAFSCAERPPAVPIMSWLVGAGVGSAEGRRPPIGIASARYSRNGARRREKLAVGGFRLRHHGIKSAIRSARL